MSGMASAGSGPGAGQQQQQPSQCLYGDPSVFVKTEYDQDSPNPGPSMSVLSGVGVSMSPSSSSEAGGASASSSGMHHHVAGHASHVGHVGGHAHHAHAHSGSGLWAKTQQLPVEMTRQLHAVYGDHFPMEVRRCLAGWLEASFADELDTSNPEHEEHARALVISLVHQVETKAAETADFLLKTKLDQNVDALKQRYGHNPIALYHIVRHCLMQEMSLLKKAELLGLEHAHVGALTPTGPSSSPSSAVCTSDAAFHIVQQLSALKKDSQDCQVEIDNIRQIQERHSLNFYKHHQISLQLDGGQFAEHSPDYINYREWRDSVAAELRQSFNNAKLQASNMINHHLEAIKQLKELQYRIVEQELSKWKREQQLAGNGAPFANNLDQIQKWFEDIAEIIWTNRQEIRQLEMIREGLNIPREDITMNLLPELSDGLAMLLDSLVKNSFVIEKQPPQVLKTNTRFSATVRLLVGTKLGVHMNPPIVTVSIISEAQANALLRTGGTRKSKSEFSSGEILNNKQTMEYHQATGQLSVSFRNMSLKKIKRAEKKGTESVMDEKFALLFWCEFTIGSGEYSYQVLAPSLPVVVIVHGNQEPHAWATILWDNAFAEFGRQPFLVPDKVPWCQVAATLNMKFKASCGRALSEDNLRYLACKAFRSSHSHGYSHHDFAGAMMSWSQFCKEPLPDRSFTFWDWFHAVMKLTKEDLRGLWIDGALLGFISRQESEEYLHKSPNGTFLIRFSDSELGGVTVAWITVNESSGGREVAMLQPFTRKDLMIRSLPDRIFDCVQMLTLYPDVPKEQAFGKYYSQQHEAAPQRNPRNGYVAHHLVNVIQGHSSSSSRTTDSVPGTPTHHAYCDPQSPVAVAAARSPEAPNNAGGSDLMRELEEIQMDDLTTFYKGFTASARVGYAGNAHVHAAHGLVDEANLAAAGYPGKQ